MHTHIHGSFSLVTSNQNMMVEATWTVDACMPYTPRCDNGPPEGSILLGVPMCLPQVPILGPHNPSGRNGPLTRALMHACITIRVAPLGSDN